MKIATHSGSFHADDVFAIAILKKVYPDAVIVRTRNPETLAQADMRVDVGQQYNPETGDFDHHQPESAGKRDNNMPYASAGLIWKHFGQQLVDKDTWYLVDDQLIAPVDALDNGIAPTGDFHPFNVTDIIADCKPTWQESDDVDDRFTDAVSLAEKIIDRRIAQCAAASAATALVKQAIAESPDKRYVVLEQYCSWKHVAVEYSELQFVVYQNYDGNWNVHAVPQDVHNFAVRTPLPEDWAGKTNKALAEVTGVDDAVFCHRARFLCAAKSKEGALTLAQQALTTK